MIAIYSISVARGKLENLIPRQKASLVIMGFCQLGGFLLWMYALPVLPLANMYVVSFMTPMAVAGLASIFLKEPLSLNRVLTIAVGFSGVIIAVNPSTLLFNTDHGLPYLYLFGNMLFSALQMFLLRHVADKETSESTAFYSRFILALGGLALCLTGGIVPLKLRTFLALCGSGVLGGLGWTLLAQAFKYASASAVAPFQYSQLVWGALLGYLFWSERITVHLICGAAIIVASALYLIREERRISRTMPRID